MTNSHRFDELQYTTKVPTGLDKRKAAAAAALASEIECKGRKGQAGMAIGRGSGPSGDDNVENSEGLDEESLHSGVQRDNRDTKASLLPPHGLGSKPPPAGPLPLSARPQAPLDTFGKVMFYLDLGSYSVLILGL